MPSGSSANADAQAASRPLMAQRVGLCERALELGGDDRVGLARFVAGAFADRVLVLALAPAGGYG
jgi:hypothetical protein